MKTVYFIRHGKSSWDDSSLQDKERPLKKRGVKNAKLMAKVIHNRGIISPLLVSSPANRALSTAKIFAGKLKINETKIIVNDQLYFEGLQNILKVIHEQDDRHQVMFIFGHNPDITELANKFSDKAIDNVPTCGVVGVEFKADTWEALSYSIGKMIYFDYPSNHK